MRHTQRKEIPFRNTEFMTFSAGVIGLWTSPSVVILAQRRPLALPASPLPS